MYRVNMPCIYKSMQGIRVLPSMERLHYISLNAVTYSKSGMGFLPRTTPYINFLFLEVSHHFVLNSFIQCI